MKRLLFIDDEPAVLDGIRRALRDVRGDWECACATSVEDGLSILRRQAVDLVVTDIKMPGMDGFDLLRSITSSEAWRHIPVIVLSGLSEASLKRRALECGAFDLISKPVSREDLIVRIRSVLRAKEHERMLEHLNATLEAQVRERTRELDASRSDILLCLAMAGECRDTDTGHHLIRVAQYSKCLGESLQLSPSEVECLHKASPLHDIGKIGVPDSVLCKPGPLSAEERLVMRQHCEIGHRILTVPTELATAFSRVPEICSPSLNPLLHAAAVIALSHHERWDGEGYPHRLVGREIPQIARIVSVADAYDALTTRRPYKEAIPHEQATTILQRESGTQFDPEVIAAFNACSRRFNQIRHEWMHDNERTHHSLCEQEQSDQTKRRAG